MCLAVSDVECAVHVDKDSVRPGELALAWFGFRAVTTLPAAQRGRDDAGVQVNTSDHVVFGIGDIERVVSPVC